MIRNRVFGPAVWLLLIIISVIGCGQNKAPLGPFQPEIVNLQDSFQFQATALKNVSVAEIYNWQNSGTTANIDQSCAITNGIAAISILDGNGAQVYSGDLTTNGSFTSAVGVAGTWHISVDISSVYGTMNFRVQKP